mmetsp:Transcript_2550/g.6130  ORF Transcript_2550/g.6130 Transcript_2550/m.6130 type:complete len:218 (+) Transcript_2550:277-930(+)
MVRSMETCKSFEAIKMARFLEDLGVEFDGTVCRENTRASAFGMFRMDWVRRAVCTQEKLGQSASCRLHKCLSMDLGLENRKAVQMWSNTSHEHVCEFNVKGNKLADDGSSQNFITSDGIARTIPIVNQMLWGDASLDVGWCLIHNIIHGLFGANVFHRDFQGWELFYQRFHDFFDEDRFPVENISFCDLGMNAKHHPYLFHFFQDRVNVLDVGDTKG